MKVMPKGTINLKDLERNRIHLLTRSKKALERYGTLERVASKERVRNSYRINKFDKK